MKERPILFSAPMVRAILAGTKTQTRRALKVQPTVERSDGAHRGMLGHPELAGLFAEHVFGYCFAKMARCPYGVPADRLWVRETWQTTTTPDDRDTSKLEFAADWNGKPGFCEDEWTWRPSIFMPRWASRITLEVTGVRVERLQDISELDALAEGVEGRNVDSVLDGKRGEYVVGSARDEFVALWDKINGDLSFLSNPWVWVVEFRRVEAQERAA